MHLYFDRLSVWVGCPVHPALWLQCPSQARWPVVRRKPRYGGLMFLANTIVTRRRGRRGLYPVCHSYDSIQAASRLRRKERNCVCCQSGGLLVHDRHRIDNVGPRCSAVGNPALLLHGKSVAYPWARQKLRRHCYFENVKMWQSGRSPGSTLSIHWL